jgi:hypothetical protein
MANKLVPSTVEGVALHPRARQRTRALLRDLEELGVRGLTQTKSQSDRLRLLATYIFSMVKTEVADRVAVG